MVCKDCHDSRPGIRAGMRRLGVAVAIAVLVAGCGGGPAEQAASSPDAGPSSTPTTTGLIPTGVPTEGTRPPTETLPENFGLFSNHACPNSGGEHFIM